MPILPTIVLYDKGAAGAPTTTNPQPLRGLDGYTHTISDRFGFESASCGWPASRADVLEWARVDHLGRHMEAYSPDGTRIWEGQLVEIAITFGTKKLVFALKDMANRLTLRYTATTGAQAATSVYSSAASIAAFGTKDRLLSLSTVAATAADNRVQTALNQIAYPTVKQSSDAGTGGGGDLRVDLTFAGWYWTLDWLLTTSTSTTSTATNTQVASLLTAYNTTNAFFHATSDLVATGLSDTEFIDDNSTYREKVETLLAHGNSSKQRLAWGVYEDRRFRAEVWAGASPTTITYYEHAASGRIVDAAGNVVEPWNVRPNAMAQLVDVLDSTMDGAIEGPTRKYIARVSCRIDSGGASVTLEPDSVDTLDALLSSPTGAGPAGTSERQAAFERKVVKPARTVFSGTDGRVDLGGGAITTGGGSIDLTSGGGTVTLPGGGGTITLPPPSGGGSSSLLDGSGTAGQLAKWTAANTLGNATAGTDYATAGHTHTPSGTGLAPIGAKYIVQQADADLTNEQSLGALATGLLKNTTTSGVLSIAVAGTDYVAPSALDEAIDDRVGSLLVAGNLITLTYNDAGNSLTIAVSSLNETIDDRVAALLVAGTGISLSYNDAGNALTISSTGGTVGGTGTAGRLMQWASGGADAENSTLIKSGAGVLTLSVASTQTITIGSGGGTLNLAGGVLTLGPDLTTSGAGSGITLSAGGAYTLTIPATGTALLGTGAAKNVPFFSGTNTVTSTTDFQFDNANSTLTVRDQILVQGSNAGFYFDERDGSGSWVLYATGSTGYIALGATNLLAVSSSNVLPNGAGSINLGNASQYWNDVSYKTLTDRGCLGWYDEGVELQDGRVVTDVAALKAIKPHPYKRTPAGAVRMDYSTLPKHVYRPVEIATEPVYGPDGQVLYRGGEPIGEEGAETTALIAILVGAIKELDARLSAVE